jgi:hypothetical protein
MGWNSYNRNWDIPRLTTYDSAARHESLVKPIRGDKDGTKPLGARNKKYYNIRKDGNDIVVRMHNTDIVRYHPDDTLTINNGGWVSPTTHDMFSMLLGLRMHTQHHRAWVHCFNRSAIGMSAPQIVQGAWRLPNNVPVRIVPHEGHWLLDDAEENVTHAVNRKAANKVRKEYTEFRKYLSAITKLRTEYVAQQRWNGPDVTVPVVRISREELEAHNLIDYTAVLQANRKFASQADNLKGLIRSDKTENNYRAVLTIMRAAHEGRYWISSEGIMLAPERVNKTFDELIMFMHRYEVLEKKPAKQGVVSRDRYMTWF